MVFIERMEKMLRPAKRKDLDEIAKLIMVILKDMELPFLSEVPEEKTLEILKQAALKDDYRYSLKRGLVYEKDGKVAGVAFAYRDDEEPIVDLPLKKVLKNHGFSEDLQLFTDKETFPNEFYLDTISVAKEFRGQGIGHKLLEALPKWAKENARHKVGLAVDKGNPKAKKLYQEMGFKEVGLYQLSGHDYDHMQWRVEDK